MGVHFQATDTTGVALSAAILLLAIHQDCQEKVYQEMRRVLGASNNDISLKELNSLTYMDQCIKESLRLFPTVPLIGRCPSEPVVLNGVEIPAGVTVMVGIRQIHRKKEYWGENALEYVPERFKDFKENDAYLPFSMGPRNCIGK